MWKGKKSTHNSKTMEASNSTDIALGLHQDGAVALANHACVGQINESRVHAHHPALFPDANAVVGEDAAEEGHLGG